MHRLGLKDKEQGKNSARASWPKMWIMGKWTCLFLSVVWTAELGREGSYHVTGKRIGVHR